jgi:hypothetical protein
MHNGLGAIKHAEEVEWYVGRRDCARTERLGHLQEKMKRRTVCVSKRDKQAKTEALQKSVTCEQNINAF